MPALTADQKASLIASTRPAAEAFVEDMEYISDVTRRLETSRGEVRRLSAVLRRLLCEGDLSNIAAPRKGRLKLLAPDNKPFYDAERVVWYPFFASGGAHVFGTEIAALCMMNGGNDYGADPAEFARQITEPVMQRYNADRRIELGSGPIKGIPLALGL